MSKKQYEKIEDSCGDCSLNALDINTDEQRSLIAKEYDPNSEHPTPEQLMVRQAIKYLTPKQKKVWELWNYEKLTQDEIGKKLGITHQAVSKHLQMIEVRITKWVKSNIGAYNLLKTEFSEND